MTDAQKIEGLWRPAYAEFDGEEAPKMALDKMELELTSAGKYFVRFGGVTGDEGTYTVTPEALTLHGVTGPNAGKKIPSLFKFNGEMLSVCYGLDGVLPTRYATGVGQQRYLVNYHRI
ncbi:TIGR03067 domain-containing protein [Oleiharenicola lentus]|uniref:TIGR03067 domain-containing protein n=1 Tax=Oleiharenicola lentus TaxID=2508720 RepID=UPI003F672CF6